MNNSIIIRLLTALFEESAIVELVKDKLGLNEIDLEVDYDELTRQVSRDISIEADDVDGLDTYIETVLDNEDWGYRLGMLLSESVSDAVSDVIDSYDFEDVVRDNLPEVEADSIEGLDYYVDSKIEDYLNNNPIEGSDVTELVKMVNDLKAQNEILKKQMAEVFQRMSHASRAFNDVVDPSSL